MPTVSPRLVLVLILAAVFGAWLIYRLIRNAREKNRTYAELLADYKRWERTVTEWRHPNGMPVDFDERGKLNDRYVKAGQRLRSHPDYRPEDTDG